ncbi:MAG: (deoxy)nucleoside triphosphate pyrophosphohydrolase [Steroidobacteraceae bacterium]|jgi:8-oxo-dGTP diphosphatase|nr:(deoxy)nucleoside triphosphate pyrophosphohydrolase [Steroidobacteraceae bacterium]
MSESPVRVVAGALVDARGRVLIAQRPPGKALAGRWEFPGGKRLAHEAARDTLNRELLEELGIQVSRARPLLAVTHRYAPDAPAVHIDCWLVEGWRGEIAPLDGQQLRWCEREELPDADILEADRPIVTALRLPATFVRVDDPDTLVERIPVGRTRERVAWIVPALPRDPGVVRRLRDHGDALFVLDPHGPPELGAGRVDSAVRPVDRAPGDRTLRGVLVHSADDARRAAAHGADFVLVPERGLATEDWPGIAALGLPFYVNVAAPAPPAAMNVAATGKLWWKSGGLGGIERL